jgi:hypothetical protein
VLRDCFDVSAKREKTGKAAVVKVVERMAKELTIVKALLNKPTSQSLLKKLSRKIFNRREQIINKTDNPKGADCSSSDFKDLKSIVNLGVTNFLSATNDSTASLNRLARRIARKR